MAATLMSPAVESEANVRKRVGKACDRCRMKKSKCDGNSPCSRCTADGSPSCSFGERKKSHRVCPDGYVDWLEQQQVQLVTGCQELYQRLLAHDAWDGTPLPLAPGGKPSTHHILEHLGILRPDPSVSRHASFDSSSSSMRQKLSLATVTEPNLTCDSPGSISSPYPHDDFSSGVPSGTTSMSSVSHASDAHLTPSPVQPVAKAHPRSTQPPSLVINTSTTTTASSRSHSTSTPQSQDSSPRKRARPNLSLSGSGHMAALQHPSFHLPPGSDATHASTATTPATTARPQASSRGQRNRYSADMSIASQVAHYQRRARHEMDTTPHAVNSLFVEPAWSAKPTPALAVTRGGAGGVNTGSTPWGDLCAMDFLTSDEEHHPGAFGPFDFAGLGLGEGAMLGAGGTGGGIGGGGGAAAGGGAGIGTGNAQGGFSELDYAEYLDPGAFAGGDDGALVLD